LFLIFTSRKEESDLIFDDRFSISAMGKSRVSVIIVAQLLKIYFINTLLEEVVD
jgi:hypothetical protein